MILHVHKERVDKFDLQWCSRDHNLRDRDLVKILRRDREQNSTLETSKFVRFAEIFHKNVVITSDHGRPQGGKMGICPPWRLKLSTKNL